MARQTEILGMKVQREYKGPAARLVELLDDNDRNYVGIVFYEQFRNHSALTNSLDGLMGFLQCPVARGITPLHSYGYEQGAFIYETGKCKSVAELIRQASDLGLSPGPRAGLELMVQSMEILQGALRIAEEYAIFSHGGLTPWRLMIRSDGKLQIIGFAVPQVEVLDYKANPNLIPSEDSFRYAPPERMEMDAMEDFSSDLFALALIGFEMMTTRPMYDGSISAIQESAQRADVSMRLNQAMVSGWLDQYTHDFLDQCLRLDHDDRFAQLSQAISAGKNLLRQPHLQGMSLFDLMSACSQQVLRQSQDVETLDVATAMFDRNALAPELLEMEADRKRQRLKEVTLGEPLEEVSEVEETRNATPEPEKSTENLLDLLRQSSISKPVMPEIKTPPPEKEKPKSGLQNDLLSALRSSVSKPVEQVLEPTPPKFTPPTEKVPESTPSASTTSKEKANKLASLLTTSTRTSSPTEPVRTPSIPSESSPTPEKSDTSQKLASLLSQSKRSSSPKVEEVAIEKSISQSIPEPADSSEVTVQSTPPVSTPPSKKALPFETEPMLDTDFGEGLEDDVLDDDDCATAIMTRPTAASRTPKPPPLSPSSVTHKQKSSVKSNPPTATKIEPSFKDSATVEVTKPTVSQPEPKKVVNVSTTVVGDLHSLFGSPIPLRSSVPTVNAQKYKISLGAGRGSIKQVCSPEITGSQLVALFLCHRLLPMRMDLSGQMTSCYRLLEKGELVSGQRRLNSFASTSLMLGSVPSRTLLMPVEIHGTEGLIQLTTPINWIVSFGSMIDYLVSWLRLSATGWQVYVNQQKVDVHDVLFDVYQEGEPCTIVLRQRT